MATTAVKRATGMPGSDVAELGRLDALGYQAWIISSATIGSNATTVSNIAYKLMLNGAYVLVAASAGTALTGTIATSTTGAYIITITSGATQASHVCGGASMGAITLPTIPAGEVPIGMTWVACTATGFNGGTNSLADTSYTVSHTSFLGPTGMLIATEALSFVPG